MYSEWFDIEPDPSFSSTTSWLMPIEQPLITADFVADGGLVKMFIKIQVQNFVQVFPLPLVASIGSHVFSVMVDDDGFFFGSPFRGILYQVTSVDGSPFPQGYLSGVQLRYFLIPGGVALGGSPGGTAAWSSYDGITSALGIEP